MRFYATLWVIVLTVLSAGCKTHSNSETKSIENYTDAGSNYGGCTGNLTHKVEGVISFDQDLQRRLPRKTTTAILVAAQNALGAIPAKFADFFFRDGRIVFIENPVGFCGPLLSEAERAFLQAKFPYIEACWNVVGKRPTIFLKADPIAVNRNLLRVMGRVFVEVYLPSADLEGTKKFRALLTNLSDTFIKEVASLRAQNKTSINLDMFQDDLKPGNTEGRARFNSYLFAEAFDSFYCTANLPGAKENSRFNFRNLVEDTYSVFEPFGLASITEKEAYIPPPSSQVITSESGMPEHLIGMTVPVDPLTGKFLEIPTDNVSVSHSSPSIDAFQKSYKEIVGSRAGQLPQFRNLIPTADYSGYFDSRDPYWQKQLMKEYATQKPDTVSDRLREYNNAVQTRYAPPSPTILTRLFSW